MFLISVYFNFFLSTMVMFMSYNRAVIPLEACGNCSTKKKSAVSRSMWVPFYKSLINMMTE